MTIPNQKILYEIIRLLMVQVREEQHSRQTLIRALMTEGVTSVQIPTDEEVNARIKELTPLLQEVKKKLTNKTEGSRL